MTTEIQPANPKPSALTIMAARFSVEPAKLLSTLKETVFKNATDSQLMALTIVANEYGLNPFTKQIYAFPDKGGGIVPVVSVDGWIKLMNDQPRFDGIEFEYSDSEDGKPVSCTASIFIKDRSRPVKVTEYYNECHRNTDPWNKSPRRMLRHRAMVQCARVAFGLAGIYDEDEAETIKTIQGKVIDSKPVISTEAPVAIEDKPKRGRKPATDAENVGTIAAEFKPIEQTAPELGIESQE